MRGDGDIVVVSCYELGRQPVAAATALAELHDAGFAPRALDVAVERLDESLLRAAKLVAISAPMHTALQLGVRVAQRARELNPSAHISFFGLYATLNAAHLLARHADSCIGGEADRPLRALAEALERKGPLPAVPGVATAAHPEGPWLPRAKDVRAAALVPLRSGLPSLSKYAHLQIGSSKRLVASVEATRGCKHVCRHCPITPVYGGRFYALPLEAVLGDIDQQIQAGAEHVSFGDPDFLNGPAHALAIVEALHARWPALTFDATIKIEHLLQHRALLQPLRDAGCLFITSAVESLSDRVLAALDKGHTAADVPAALSLVRAAGLDLRPTLLPYTPWTELHDVRALFDFADEHDLVDRIEPVQFTLRLLLPPGSPLADARESWLGPFRPDAFSYSWTHPDARLDELQAASAQLASRAIEAGEDPRDTFDRLRALASADRGEPRPARSRAAREPIARLTEPWFC